MGHDAVLTDLFLQPPVIVLCDDKRERLQPIPWRLLKYVVDHQGKCDKKAAIDAIWEGSDRDHSFISAKKRINRALRKLGYPMRLSEKNGYLFFSPRPN